MLLSFIGTLLPSEEKDELKVAEETTKILKIIMEGWPNQIASWSHYDTRLSYNGSINHFSPKLACPHVACLLFVICVSYM